MSRVSPGRSSRHVSQRAGAALKSASGNASRGMEHCGVCRTVPGLRAGLQGAAREHPNAVDVAGESTVMARRSEAPAGSAIRLRGFAKRFGALTAVDGLDLDVPSERASACSAPNGAGKSTTMKALTAQVIPDAGELEVLGYRLPRGLQGAARDGGRARSSTTSTSR